MTSRQGHPYAWYYEGQDAAARSMVYKNSISKKGKTRARMELLQLERKIGFKLTEEESQRFYEGWESVMGSSRGHVGEV